mmetsp:Transcript_1091/g.1992  ORF Transcript_1091/g.1992 Transcript_1091/m.1992 type:complete len:223 (-) Transcript_1091:2581-3249(-)
MIGTPHRYYGPIPWRMQRLKCPSRKTQLLSKTTNPVNLIYQYTLPMFGQLLLYEIPFGTHSTHASSVVQFIIGRVIINIIIIKIIIIGRVVINLIVIIIIWIHMIIWIPTMIEGGTRTCGCNGDGVNVNVALWYFPIERQNVGTGIEWYIRLTWIISVGGVFANAMNAVVVGSDTGRPLSVAMHGDTTYDGKFRKELLTGSGQSRGRFFIRLCIKFDQVRTN